MSTHLKAVPAAVSDIELSQLDLRYQGHRLQQPRLEEQLLASIAQVGIQEPLQGVSGGSGAILLNGFKRARCARKLPLHTVPFVSWGTDEVAGILQLLRGARPQALHLLEQARFVDELKSERGMSVSEIAEQLSRSKAWVSLRLGLVAQLSPTVREALFSGAFPVYSYLYSLRRFRRLKPAADIDQFVTALRVTIMVVIDGSERPPPLRPVRPHLYRFGIEPRGVVVLLGVVGLLRLGGELLKGLWCCLASGGHGDAQRESNAQLHFVRLRPFSWARL